MHRRRDKSKPINKAEIEVIPSTELLDYGKFFDVVEVSGAVSKENIYEELPQHPDDLKAGKDAASSDEGDEAENTYENNPLVRPPTPLPQSSPPHSSTHSHSCVHV